MQKKDGRKGGREKKKKAKKGLIIPIFQDTDFWYM